MSRISGGDIIAFEAKYHINCLVSYKNRYRSMRRAHVSESSSNTEGRVLQARAFSELISIENGTYLFKSSPPPPPPPPPLMYKEPV